MTTSVNILRRLTVVAPIAWSAFLLNDLEGAIEDM
jgi:hypothetical protein